MPGQVEIKDLTKRYGDTLAVDAVNLTVKAGSYCCTLGPSGCGKTSTLRMIAGHEDISSGQVVIDGVDVSRAASGAEANGHDVPELRAFSAFELRG